MTVANHLCLSVTHSFHLFIYTGVFNPLIIQYEIWLRCWLLALPIPSIRPVNNCTERCLHRHFSLQKKAVFYLHTTLQSLCCVAVADGSKHTQTFVQQMQRQNTFLPRYSKLSAHLTDRYRSIVLVNKRTIWARNWDRETVVWPGREEVGAVKSVSTLHEGLVIPCNHHHLL